MLFVIYIEILRGHDRAALKKSQLVDITTLLSLLLWWWDDRATNHVFRPAAIPQTHKGDI